MCLSPLRASLQSEGRPIFHSEGEVPIPCGKCHECISRRASEWATRAKHEISEHSQNSFLTLTYNDDNLRSDFIVKEDFQNFLKRLRKNENIKFRYMVSYEYGSQRYRPHMHAILFGYDPPNQKFINTSPSGHKLYTSKAIEKAWSNRKGEPLGYHSIGEANGETAYYIASYALKGKKRIIEHPDTGEKLEIADQMDASKRPAIGLNYFLKNADQLVYSGDVLPRYYVKKLEEHFPDLHEYYQNRMLESIKNRSDHEKFAKFCIDSQKSSLHDPIFRADYENNQRNVKEASIRKKHLKFQRNQYAMRSRDKKN